MLLPALAKAKERALKVSCLSNMKQLATGTALFAQDNNGYLTGCTNYADDDVNWLYPQYVPALKSYTCPSTQHVVSNQVQATQIHPFTGQPKVADLTDFCKTKKAQPGSKRGHSYENYGWWVSRSANEPAPPSPYQSTSLGLPKSEQRLQTRVLPIGNSALGVPGNIKPGPSETWLMVDADDCPSPGTGNINDYLNKGDNHDADGANAVFADGHARWVPRIKNGQEFYKYTYIISTFEISKNWVPCP